MQKLVAGAFGLPFGLFMVLVCGGELFTGNTSIMAAAMYQGAVSPTQLVKNWLLSYAGALHSDQANPEGAVVSAVAVVQGFEEQSVVVL